MRIIERLWARWHCWATAWSHTHWPPVAAQTIFCTTANPPSWLLFLIFAATHQASWTCIYVVYGRASLLSAALALPLVAMLSRRLTPAGGSYTKLVAAAGAGAALSDLHSMLGLLHSPVLGPTGAMLGTLHWHGKVGAEEALGMRSCRTLDLWVLGMVGIVVPLTALRWMDRQARRAAAAATEYQQRQQQQREAAEQAEQAGGPRAPHVQGGAQGQGEAETDGYWLLRIAYFASCGIWAAASLLSS